MKKTTTTKKGDWLAYKIQQGDPLVMKLFDEMVKEGTYTRLPAPPAKLIELWNAAVAHEEARREWIESLSRKHPNFTQTNEADKKQLRAYNTLVELVENTVPKKPKRKS